MTKKTLEQRYIELERRIAKAEGAIGVIESAVSPFFYARWSQLQRRVETLEKREKEASL